MPASLSAASKTEQILEAFDKLQVGSALEINEETDPRALRNEMTQLRPGPFLVGCAQSRQQSVDDSSGADRRERRRRSVARARAQFTQAKATTIKELAGQMSERSYKSGDTIFDEGEMWPYLGIVKSGKVIYTLLSPDGKTHTIGERLTHDTLNESGTFDGGGATTRAEALTDATIVTLAERSGNARRRNDAELGARLLDRVARKRGAARSTRLPTSRSRTCCNAWRSSYSVTRGRQSA